MPPQTRPRTHSITKTVPLDSKPINPKDALGQNTIPPKLVQSISSTSSLIPLTTSDSSMTSTTGSKPAIKLLKLSQSDLEKIEMLDMAKHNWPTWSDMMLNLFLLNLCGGYILGTIPHPTDDSSEAATNWDINNLCVIATIKTRCTHKESHFLHGSTITKDAWATLRNRHEKLGPVAQVLLI